MIDQSVVDAEREVVVRVEVLDHVENATHQKIGRASCRERV